MVSPSVAQARRLLAASFVEGSAPQSKRQLQHPHVPTPAPPPAPRPPRRRPARRLPPRPALWRAARPAVAPLVRLLGLLRRPGRGGRVRVPRPPRPPGALPGGSRLGRRRAGQGDGLGLPRSREP